jgi:hypothetical protein
MTDHSADSLARWMAARITDWLNDEANRQRCLRVQALGHGAERWWQLELAMALTARRMEWRPGVTLGVELEVKPRHYQVTSSNWAVDMLVAPAGDHGWPTRHLHRVPRVWIELKMATSWSEKSIDGDLGKWNEGQWTEHDAVLAVILTCKRHGAQEMPTVSSMMESMAQQRPLVIPAIETVDDFDGFTYDAGNDVAARYHKVSHRLQIHRVV